MAYLSDASSSVADFSKCVISFLGRYPSTAAFAPGFLEFGNPGNISAITMNGDGSWTILLAGPNGGYSFTNGATGTISGNTVLASFNTGAISPVTDTWRRFILSIDMSGSAAFTYAGVINTYTIGHNDFRFWLSVDDTDHSPTSYQVGATTFSAQPAGSFKPAISGGSPAVSGTESLSLPSANIAISGLEYSIPCLAANADPGYNSKFEVADFMMWTGVSLDTSNSTNRRYFIDGSGNPVNPSVAIAALGTPVYFFQGPASGIATNLGSAGAAVKTGTVTDFTPGP